MERPMFINTKHNLKNLNKLISLRVRIRKKKSRCCKRKRERKRLGLRVS